MLISKSCAPFCMLRHNYVVAALIADAQMQRSGQQYEYLLFGSVAEADRVALLHRLRGLCDFAVTGGIPFKERELTYKIEAGSAAGRVKVRQSLDSTDSPWHLTYCGQVELGDSHRPTAVRTSVTAACSSNLLECLRELGFVVVSELLMEGVLFRKGHMKVAVFKLYQSTDSADLDPAHALSANHLVELSALTPSGQDTIGSEMKTFADQLWPIVNMEKTDGVR